MKNYQHKLDKIGQIKKLPILNWVQNYDCSIVSWSHLLTYEFITCKVVVVDPAIDVARNSQRKFPKLGIERFIW